MKTLTRFVTKYNWLTIIVILGITVFFGVQMPNMTIDNSIDNMLPADHPAKLLYDRVDENFGGSDILVVALQSDSVFSQTTLQQIYDLSYDFQMVDGVDDVMSMSTGKEMTGTEYGLEVSDLMADVPSTPEAIEDFKQTVLTNEMYEGTIISENGEYAGFVIQLLSDTDDETVYRGVQGVIANEPNADAFSIAGAPAVNTEMTTSMKHDLTTLFPFVILLVLISLYISFRSLQGVVLPIVTVLISVIWTLGFMALLQIPMAMISTTLPVLLIAIGSAYGIHAINGYYESLLDSHDKQEALILAMSHVGKAILMAGLTTIVGFGSLATSQVSQVKQFGVFTAFGVASALVLSIIFIPAVLMWMKVPKGRETEPEEDQESWLTMVLTGLGEFTIRHSKSLVVTGVVLLLLSVAGFPKLVVETNTLRFFKPESDIRQATEVINDHFGGSESLSILVEGDMKHPDVLNRIMEIQEYAESLNHVGYSISVADYVAEINKALNNNDPKYRTIPASRDAVAQEILLYEMSGDPSDFEQVVDYDYRLGNVSIRMESVSSSQLGIIVDDIETYAEEDTLSDFQAEVTGSSYLFKVLTDLLVKGQIWSLLTSLGLVWLIIALIFRSFPAGGYSIIPLSLTIAINFGLMGWFNIPLDTATTMLASMAIGIGVDYTIHFLSRYRVEVRRTGDYAQAGLITTRTTGKAIVYNAVAVTMGFIVLLFSSFRPIQTLGALTALTMVTSALGALTILPAVLNVVKPKFLLAKQESNNNEQEEDH